MSETKPQSAFDAMLEALQCQEDYEFYYFRDADQTAIIKRWDPVFKKTFNKQMEEGGNGHSQLRALAQELRKRAIGENAARGFFVADVLCNPLPR